MLLPSGKVLTVSWFRMIATLFERRKTVCCCVLALPEQR